MWWKIIVFAIFLCLLFILSRLREAIAYYEGGYLASRLLDPVALSARKLKLLLDQRGISYAGVVEKRELKDLVETTGDASEGEMESASQEEKPSKYTEFKGGSHFYEEVEDSKDSVWVVQVVHSPHTFMTTQEWTTFVHKVSRFGVHTGYFDCSLDEKLCERKGWFSSRLVLALPQGQKAKDNVTLKNYVGSSRTQAVLDWVNYNLASRIKEIQSVEELENDWLKFDGEKQKQNLRVILISTLKIPPMFYSVLSVKFTGRARFGTINTATAAGQLLTSAKKWSKIPSYVVLTPEQVCEFGMAPGEYPNFSSMALFLKTLQPEVNDIFLLILITVNVMCYFELVLSHGNLFKRLGSVLWHICKWNCLLILLCFPILGVFQLPYMDMVLEGALKVLRIVGTSYLASLVRADWLAYYTNSIPFLCLIFTVYACIVGLIHYKYRGPEPEANTTGALSQALRPTISWDTYASFLFQPVSGASPFGPSPRDMEIDAGVEMLIDQLSLPSIWLGPMISNDYLKELPVWKYTGPSIESDIGSDYDSPSPRVDSEGEDCLTRPDSPNLNLDSDSSYNPAMFICEKCRALQKKGTLSDETKQERAQAQMESESACAKYLMDSNYKCKCPHNVGTKSPHPVSQKPSCSGTEQPSQSSPKVSGNKSDLEDNAEKLETASPTETYHPPPGMLTAMDCSICLEGLKYGVGLCGLPCKHSFHHECIMHWLQQYNHLCPLCRWPAYKAKPCSLHQHSD